MLCRTARHGWHGTDGTAWCQQCNVTVAFRTTFSNAVSTGCGPTASRVCHRSRSKNTCLPVHALLEQARICNWKLSGSPTCLRVWPDKAVYEHLHHLLHSTTAQGLIPNAGSTAPGQPVTPDSGTTSTAAPASTTLQPPSPVSTGQHLLDWALLEQLLQLGTWASSGSLQLLAGGADALLPACYETHDRLLCQVSGRQRLLLLPPQCAFKGLYPFPVHHPYDRYSAVDWEDPELEHWPAAQQVRTVGFLELLTTSLTALFVVVSQTKHRMPDPGTQPICCAPVVLILPQSRSSVLFCAVPLLIFVEQQRMIHTLQLSITAVFCTSAARCTLHMPSCRYAVLLPGVWWSAV